MDEPLASQPASPKSRTPRERLVTSDYDVFIKKTRKPETILVTPTPTVDTTNRLGQQTESPIVEESVPIQRSSSFSASQLLLNSLVFIALPAFMVSTLILYSKSSSFEKRNQILFAETKQLREALLSLEDLNKSLTVRFEKLKNEKKDERNQKKRGETFFFRISPFLRRRAGWNGWGPFKICHVIFEFLPESL